MSTVADSHHLIKGPFVRGCHLWKQLPSEIQRVDTKEEFNRLLTESHLSSLL